MARFDKSSTKRPKQNVAVAATRSPKRSTAPSIEDTMFFPRLRRHAKWMFVFLAVALGGGFVLFGVGAGGTGVGDILRGGGATSGVPSISSSEKKTEQDPKNVQAWTDLSTALQADGQTDKAIDAQKHVVALTPKDSDALRALAGLYLAQVTTKQQEAQLAQLRTAYQGAGQGFPGALQSPTGQSLVDDRISVILNTQGSTKIQKLAGEAQTASAGAVAAYKADRQADAERPEHSARARPGRPAGRRRTVRDRGLHRLPQARSGRPECDDREAAAEAAETEFCRVGIDSRGR